MNHRKTTGKWLRLQFDLIIVLFIAIIVAIFSLFVGLADRFYNFFSVYAGMPIIRFIIVEASILLLGLLWIAYRRWRISYKRHVELENIINGINPDVLLVVDPQRDIIVCNSSVSRMFGYNIDEVIGKQTDFLYSDRRINPEYTGEIYETLEKEGFHIGEAKGIRKGGETIPLEIITGNLSGREGAVLLLRDISERKSANFELQQSIQDLEFITKEMNASKANFQNIVKRLFDGVILLDWKGIVRLVNPVAEIFLGSKAENIIGKPFDKPIVPGEPNEILITRKDGQKGVGELIAMDTEWEGRNAKIVFIRDVTNLREAEDAREHLYRQFERLLVRIDSEDKES